MQYKLREENRVFVQLFHGKNTRLCSEFDLEKKYD